MNEATEQRGPVEPMPSNETGSAIWQAPAYDVVDTALEVTAYSLSSR